MVFDWLEGKKRILQSDRGISFEQVVVAIEQGGVLAVLENPNQEKYRGQRLYIVEVEGYAWVVPYRDKGDRRILLTAFPSRKYTKQFLGREPDRDENG